MVVLGGADDMVWNLIISTDGSTANDSAYHEYFVVIQAPQGEMVHIEDINIGASFRNPNALWFDGWDHISMTLGDVIWGPPQDIECYEGDEPPEDACGGEGVCAQSQPVCAKGEWLCVTPDSKELVELTCDGLDNDCDGLVDEELFQDCSTECGKGQSQCVLGSWVSCDAQQPSEEECNGVDDDCDGLVDNSPECYPSIPDIVWEDEPVEEEEPEFDLSLLQDDEEKEDKAPESIEDPIDQVDVWGGADNIPDYEPKTEVPEDEILVEVVPASGCHSADKGTIFWGTFVLLMLMYVAGCFVGHACCKKDEQDRK